MGVRKLRCGMQFVPINLYVTVDIVNLLQARTHAPAYRKAHSHGLTAGRSYPKPSLPAHCGECSVT